MATKKKEDTKKKGGKEKDAEKEAKRKARMEALKNRPAEQRPNSKQIDVIGLILIYTIIFALTTNPR